MKNNYFFVVIWGKLFEDVLEIVKYVILGGIWNIEVIFLIFEVSKVIK